VDAFPKTVELFDGLEIQILAVLIDLDVPAFGGRTEKSLGPQEIPNFFKIFFANGFEVRS